ncbi:MAG TPA: hypothetical protein VGM19_00815 [Armatimonadota bacterium]|jgi:hypothetical protein
MIRTILLVVLLGLVVALALPAGADPVSEQQGTCTVNVEKWAAVTATSPAASLLIKATDLSAAADPRTVMVESGLSGNGHIAVRANTGISLQIAAGQLWTTATPDDQLKTEWSLGSFVLDRGAVMGIERAGVPAIEKIAPDGANGFTAAVGPWAPSPYDSGSAFRTALNSAAYASRAKCRILASTKAEYQTIYDSSFSPTVARTFEFDYRIAATAINNNNQLPTAAMYQANIKATISAYTP